MSREELDDYFSALRSRTRDKKTGAIKGQKKSAKSKVELMLEKLSPAERAAVLQMMQAKKG